LTRLPDHRMLLGMMNTQDAAAKLEALGNPTRLSLYRLLVRAGHSGLSVGQCQQRLEIAASTLSHHLKALVIIGLVSQERDGTTLICRMLALLQGLGLSAAVAVGIGAMVGPSQVAGRLVEMLFGTAIDPVTTAWTSAALMPVGFVLLTIGGSAAALAGLFAIAYGISMGLSSIVRGTVPLKLFGPAGYGAMLGKLSAPGLVVKAAAPLLFAMLVERAGLMPSTLLLVALSGLAAAALFILAGRLRSFSR